MKKVFALVALAGIASVAVAGPNSLSFQVSTDNGASWGSAANATTGQTVKVRMVVDWSGNTAYGFAAILAKLQFSNIADDTAPGTGSGFVNVAPYNYGLSGGTRASLSGSTRTWGLAGAAGTSIGFLSFSQNTPAASGSNYATANSVVIGAFDVVAGSGLGRVLSISALISGTQSTGNGNPTGAFKFSRQLNAAGDGPDISISRFAEDGTVNAGTITIVPTPGALALLGLGGLVTGRRRR